MRKVRIGIIGAGWWGVANHIPVLQSFPEVEVAGICRLGQEQLRNLQARFSIPFGTETYQDLLDLENLDGVVISTPHHLHFEQAHAALERGLHVVCEKPMVLRASEAWQLAELARSKNLHFLIPLGWNYKDYAITAKQRIDLGAIGKIEYVHCHMASALRDLFSGTGAWFAETALVKPEMRTWSDATVGGGFAHGQFSHALGLLFYITGMQAAGSPMAPQACWGERGPCLRLRPTNSTSACLGAKECYYSTSSGPGWKSAETTARIFRCRWTIHPALTIASNRCALLWD
jgi:predicted dehydrogenase